jgi:hypothetical protein
VLNVERLAALPGVVMTADPVLSQHDEPDSHRDSRIDVATRQFGGVVSLRLSTKMFAQGG